MHRYKKEQSWAELTHCNKGIGSTNTMLGFKFILALSFILGIEGEYTYHKQAGGWLKLHQRPATWHDARLRCHLEGAVLASPSNSGLLQAMKEKLSRMGSSNNNIFVGFHATFSKGDFFSIEGVPIEEAPITWEPHNYRNKADCVTLDNYGQVSARTCDDYLPYICFKGGVLKAFEVGPCGPTENGYMLDNRTLICYKLHTTARTWSRAFMACSVERAHLAVINSDLEAQVLRDLFAEHPKSSMVGSFNKEYAYIGVQDWGEREDWETVHGQTLTAAGYARFDYGEPNGSGGCLVVMRNGLLNDVACDSIHAFFCEKRPAVYLTSQLADYVTQTHAG